MGGTRVTGMKEEKKEKEKEEKEEKKEKEEEEKLLRDRATDGEIEGSIRGPRGPKKCTNHPGKRSNPSFRQEIAHLNIDKKVPQAIWASVKR